MVMLERCLGSSEESGRLDEIRGLFGLDEGV